MLRHHKCAVTDCDAQVIRTHLMCVKHWKKVTATTQRLVFATRYAWQGGRLSEHTYAAAVDQAKKEASA